MSQVHNPAVPKKSWFARHKILTGFLVLFILAALGSGGDKNGVKNTPAPSAEVAKEEVKKNDPKITLEEFNAIKTGMTYEQVVNIVGSEGTVMSEVEMSGFKTVMYQFKGNKFASNANVTIQNKKVVSKAQFGL